MSATRQTDTPSPKIEAMAIRFLSAQRTSHATAASGLFWLRPKSHEFRISPMRTPANANE